MIVETYIYSNIFDTTALEYIKELEANKSNDIVTRLNTRGGDPNALFGMATKFKEHPMAKVVKVDGAAYSCGLFFCCYADKVIGSSVSSYVLHRAANWAEDYIAEYPEIMTQADWDLLAMINNSLKTALESKIDTAKLKELKGVTLDEVFSTDTRIDVNLNADEALAIGLISEIYNLTDSDKKIIASKLNTILASSRTPIIKDVAKIEPITNSEMTKEQLKKEHPEVYASIHKDGYDDGYNKAVAYVEDINAYKDIDAELCSRVIAEKRAFTNAELRQLNVKALAKEQGATIETPAPVINANNTPPENPQASNELLDKLRQSVKSNII